MTAKRFTVLKKLETSDIYADVIDTYIEKLVKEGKSVGWVTVGILDNGNPMTYKECVDLLNENEQLKKQITSLKVELDIHKHPLWSTREAERKVSELTELLADEVKKNGELLKENNLLRIENKRLKEVQKYE